MQLSQWPATAAALGLSAVASMATPTAAGAGALSPIPRSSCYDISTTLGPVHKVWIGTDVASMWLAGPGSITGTERRTATATSKFTGRPADEESVYAKAAQALGHRYKYSNSVTSEWTLGVTVPAGKTARGRVYGPGAAVAYHNVISYGPSCASYGEEDGWYDVAEATDDPSEYCTAAEPARGSDIVDDGPNACRQ